jgi:hypothetical protein
VLLRRTIVLCIVAGVILGPLSSAVHAEESPHRAIVLAVDGTTLQDWTRPGLPHFRRLIREGGVALLSTRTAVAPKPSFEEARLAAYATLVQGRREGPSPLPLPRSPLSLVSDYATSKTGTDYGVLARAVRSALAGTRALIVSPGDPAHVERFAGMDEAARERLMHLSMRRIDSFLGTLRDMLTPSDLLLVLSPVPPVTRLQRRIHLGAIAALGPGVVPGELTSGTTRRDGVVSLTDIAPTVLSWLGVPPPAHMDGRRIEARFRGGALASVRSLERDVVHSASARLKLTRLMMVAGMLMTALALATVAGARGGAAGNGRWPRGWRDALATTLIGVSALPLALLLEPLLPTDTTSSAIPAVVALAALFGVGLRAAVGRRNGMIAVLAATAGLALADLALGSPLSSRSTLGFQIAGGGRFYGVDEGMMGVIVGSGLFAAALALDRADRPHRIAPWVAGGLAAAVFLLGAPSFGSKFGAAFTAIPAFGLLAVRAGGRRIDRIAVLGIAIATVFTSAAFAVADALRNPEAQSHIGRVVAGATESGSVLGDKISAFARITFTTIWLPAFVWFALAVGWMLWRRRAQLGRALWGMPNFRAALWAALVASLIAFATNDTGVITAAPIALLASAALFQSLLAPE